MLINFFTKFKKEVRNLDELVNKKNIINSLVWKIIELGGSQLITFVIQIILARILSPSEFGTMSILLVFVNIAQVFVQGGFNVALVQKKEADNLDFSSVLYFSLGISFLLYILLFYTAPWISEFYGDYNLTIYLRTIGIVFFAGAVNSVQLAYLQRKLQFQVSARSSLIANTISGIIGIVAAYMSFGIWALLIQQCMYQILNCIIVAILSDWKPLMKFSLYRIKEMFIYGSSILGSNLISNIYLEIRTLIIGRTYNSTSLGYYKRGEQFPNVIVRNVDGAIQAVLLPSLSSQQSDIKIVKRMVRRSLKTSSFLIFPAMVGMAVTAKNIVVVVLGEKWIPATSLLIIFSLTYAIWPIITINLQPMRALGRSDLILKTEIIKKSIGLVIILITVPISIKAVAIGFMIERYVETIINAIPNKKLINYTYIEQIKDILPSAVQAILMGIIIYFVNFLKLDTLKTLGIQIVVGASINIALSYILNNEAYTYLLNTTKSYLKRS